ncbi:MAG: MFS transporter, partial [Bacilli bacterium]|nr:MFS transporter [Bacilli bacterium]
MEENTKTISKVGLRNWLIIVIVGLAGQFAWAIENMYLNTYITYLNFSAPIDQAFDYSLMIAITTAASAVVATFTTLFMGVLSDRINKRKIFISLGYILWGISTASFGLFNVNSSASLFVISMTASSAAIMVIVIDCLMTFLGSSANDAAFNSYITKSIKDENRAKVEGVLSILPLVAMLLIFVALNGLTTEEGGNRWDLFFYIVGGLVVLVGLASLFLVPKDTGEKDISQSYKRLLIEGFRPSIVKDNKKLYFTLLLYFIYGVAIQVYFPYLMVYIEKSCHISNAGGFSPFVIVMAVALVLGSALSVLVGFIADRVGKEKMIAPVFAILGAGLLMMFFIPYFGDDVFRTIAGAVSGLVMILGYVAVPTILNAIVREYIPKGKEGTFLGV